MRTVVRNTNWHDPITLYEHDVKISDNYDIENNLAVAYEAKGEFSKMIPHMQRSVEFLPYGQSVYNLAAAYELSGDKKKAEIYYDRVIHQKNLYFTPSIVKVGAYLRLINMVYQSDPKRAEQMSEKSVQEFPGFWQLWFELSDIHYLQKNKKQALMEAQKAQQLNSTSATKNLYNDILTGSPIKLPSWSAQ